MKREVVATARAKWAKPGTRKMMEASMAKAVVALGHATYAEAKPATAATVKRTYNRRDMTAQPVERPAWQAAPQAATPVPGATTFGSFPGLVTKVSGDGETQ